MKGKVGAGRDQGTFDGFILIMLITSRLEYDKVGSTR